MQKDSVYTRINRVLNWKKIIAFNVLMFLVLVIPISVRLAQESTENRSLAEETIASTPTPQPAYPGNSPRIDRVRMFYGRSGDTIILLGNNFGDYQWKSKVYVGNSQASETDVVRWSNGVVEVRIPINAKTGRVWINVDGKQAYWDGSLLLYDVAYAASIGLARKTDKTAMLWLGKADAAVRGVVEIGYVGEPIEISAGEGVTITSEGKRSDKLGQILKVEFEIDKVLPRAKTSVLVIDYEGTGALEILRAELYDQGNALLNIYSEPLSVKIVL